MIEFIQFLSTNILYLGIFLLLYLPAIFVLHGFADAIKERYIHSISHTIKDEDNEGNLA